MEREGECRRSLVDASNTLGGHLTGHTGRVRAVTVTRADGS
jgi:hypothetical protein